MWHNQKNSCLLNWSLVNNYVITSNFIMQFLYYIYACWKHCIMCSYSGLLVIHTYPKSAVCILNSPCVWHAWYANNDVIPTDNDVISTDNDVIPTDNDVIPTDNDVISTDNDVISADPSYWPVWTNHAGCQTKYPDVGISYIHKAKSSLPVLEISRWEGPEVVLSLSHTTSIVSPILPLTLYCR